MNKLLPWLLLLPLTACAAQTNFEHLQALARTDHYRIESADPGGVYHVYVRVPDRYAEGDDPAYPAVYVLDGGNMFPLLAGYYRYLELGEEIPDLILVGISYGTDYYRHGNQRNRDYTAPAVESDFWGGADRFLDLLRREIIPLVESRYRSDPGRRIVFGQSLGGQFALHAALQEPTLFWGHIAVNPALHRNLDRFLVPAAEGAFTDEHRARVYVASSELDLPRLRGPALSWIGHWTALGERPWDLKAEVLPGESHFSAAPAGFRLGVRWLFEEGASPDTGR